MTAPPLRPYQADIINKVEAEITVGRRCILLVAPTGAGKTVIATEIASRAIGRRQRVLFLAHRRELILQAARKMHEAGLDHGVWLPGYPLRVHAPVQVASIATMHARTVRSNAAEAPDVDLILIDEAHHARARTYRTIIDRYPNAVVIGLTATPCRGDGRGLGSSFEMILECPSVAELISLGHLVPTRVYAPSVPDLKGVRIERGDYVESELAKRVDTAKLVGDVVEHWFRLGNHRKTVVFATGVQHSVHLRDEFRRAGVMAEHIDGTTPPDERDAILSRLDRGDVDLVTNAQVLTEGWDSPQVSCLVLARPTKSLGLYRQIVGRVLRPAPGKTDALILDHAGATFMHGFVDDEITWTLAEDERAENRTHAARVRDAGDASDGPIVTCPECRAVRFHGKACKACGWAPRPKAAPVIVEAGDLGEVSRDRTVRDGWTPEMRRKFLTELTWIAHERNYKLGWPAALYREKFGAWPPTRRGVIIVPEMPSPATRSWVRSRAIAFAKSRHREAAQ